MGHQSVPAACTGADRMVVTIIAASRKTLTNQIFLFIFSTLPSLHYSRKNAKALFSCTLLKKLSQNTIMERIAESSAQVFLFSLQVVSSQDFMSIKLHGGKKVEYTNQAEKALSILTGRRLATSQLCLRTFWFLPENQRQGGSNHEDHSQKCGRVKFWNNRGD